MDLRLPLLTVLLPVAMLAVTGDASGALFAPRTTMKAFASEQELADTLRGW